MISSGLLCGDPCRRVLSDNFAQAYRSRAASGSTPASTSRDPCFTLPSPSLSPSLTPSPHRIELPCLAAPPAQDITNDYNAILTAAVALPFWINGFGILASLLGIALVRNTKLDDSATLDTLLKTITNGVWLASAGTTAFTALAVGLLFRQDIAWKLFGATVIGLVAGGYRFADVDATRGGCVVVIFTCLLVRVVWGDSTINCLNPAFDTLRCAIAGVIIAKFTEYCTAYEFAPTRDISAASEYGAAPVIIKGGYPHGLLEMLMLLTLTAAAAAVAVMMVLTVFLSPAPLSCVPPALQ